MLDSTLDRCRYIGGRVHGGPLVHAGAMQCCAYPCAMQTEWGDEGQTTALNVKIRCDSADLGHLVGKGV